MGVLQFQILDNSPVNLAWFLAIILVAFLVRKYLSQLTVLLLYKFFKRFTPDSYLKKFESLVIQPLQMVVYFMIVRLALLMLNYPSAWKVTAMNIPLQKILSGLISTLIWWAVTWLLLRMIEFVSFLMRMRAQRTKSKLDDQWVPFVKDTMKVVLIIFSILFLLGAVFRLNITSLLAGVGIGGLAIALAAQESLKNLFGSITIFSDKPFIIGDFVKIGDVEGIVEKVGFRSTRIRTTEKTFVTLPNKVMVDSSVNNLSLRTYRKVNLTVGLRYETKPESIRKIVEEIQQLFHEYDETADEETDNYAVFDSFGESSLNLEIQYFIPQKPFTEFLKEKQEFNFKVMEIILKHGSDFAYPVREIRTIKAEKAE